MSRDYWDKSSATLLYRGSKRTIAWHFAHLSVGALLSGLYWSPVLCGYRLGIGICENVQPKKLASFIYTSSCFDVITATSLSRGLPSSSASNTNSSLPERVAA